MLKLHEEGMWKAESCPTLGLLHHTVSQVVDAKKKFLKDIKSPNSSEHTSDKKGKQPIANMEKVLVVWIEDQTNHNIPLSHSLIQSKGVNSLQFHDGCRRKGWFMRFKERSSLHNINVQGEAANADVEAETGYPEDLAKIINYYAKSILLVLTRACMGRGFRGCM